MKTTEVDLEKVSQYLKNQIGWVQLDQIGKAIPAKHVNGMKVDAMKHIGLIERDGGNVKLTTDGREYAGGDAAKRAEIMRRRLRTVPLFHATLEWMHWQNKTLVTKTDVAIYWHDNHPAEIGGAQGDALTDPAVFFMRMVGVAGLGKFVAAGAGRETHLKVDEDALTEYATGEPPPLDEPGAPAAPPVPPPSSPAPSASQLTVAGGLNVNVEIHIAADAKAATIEEIFKNMRKYLIDGPDSTVDGG